MHKRFATIPILYIRLILSKLQKYNISNTKRYNLDSSFRNYNRKGKGRVLLTLGLYKFIPSEVEGLVLSPFGYAQGKLRRRILPALSEVEGAITYSRPKGLPV
jgi:hypothetical protein